MGFQTICLPCFVPDYLTVYMLANFTCFLLSAELFQNLLFQNTIRASSSLDPGEVGDFV